MIAGGNEDGTRMVPAILHLYISRGAVLLEWLLMTFHVSKNTGRGH